jgi:N-methylhydantoinase A
VRVGFDIGGTFTDVIVLGENGELHVAKVLSLLERVGDDIAACVEDVGGAQDVSGFVHGTTIASNAVIEGSTAKTGLLTTQGFRDELEMRGQRRPNIYDVAWNRLPPLVPRRLRLEVKERILGDGQVEQPLELESAAQAITKLLDEGVDAIAVCLLNAYLKADHERELGALIGRLAPEMTVCLSSDIHPEIREYERTSTTVINASLVPVVTKYLDRLEAQLSHLSSRLLIMQSNGGIMSSAMARERPALMIESGPAAGVLAAGRLAEENGWDRILSFDMGGTTAKACLIENGVPLEKLGGEVGGSATMATRLFGAGGHVLRVPWLDIVEVGAGGGSLAWVDEGGALRVGPQSAGAEPGPACYGRGGTQATVTDANVVLGFMNPGAIAGDTLSLDAGAARHVIERDIAGPLGLDVFDAAYGITQVANATMKRALRAVSTERGRDPREYTLLSFGGAGPMHAAALADSLGLTSIRIPPHSGLFSALGLLLADYRQDYIKSVALPLSQVTPEDIQSLLDDIEAQAHNALLAQGVARDTIRYERQVDLRYGYQVSELAVVLGPRDADMCARLRSDFNVAHLTAFGYQRDDEVELVNLRVRALAPASQTRFADLDMSAMGGKRSQRSAYFGREHGHLDTPVVQRAALGAPLAGPAIVEEPDTTVVVPPTWIVAREANNTLAMYKDGR